MSPRFVPSTDGVQVAVHELGGDGPPLLLCHATGFCAPVYAAVVTLLGRHFSVIGVDLRGHGWSTTVEDPAVYSWDRIVSDVIAVVDDLGLAGAAAFGHSLGGAMLLHAAAARPGAMGAAYLFEPIVFPAGFSHPGEHPMAPGAARRREVFASRDEALFRYAARPPLGALRAECLHAYVTHGFEELPDGAGVRLRCRAATEAAVFLGEEWSSLDRIGGVTMPVLVGAGARDKHTVAGRLAPAVATALPNGRLVEYPFLGHFGPLQDPVTIAEDAVAFLTGEHR